MLTLLFYSTLHYRSYVTVLRYSKVRPTANYVISQLSVITVSV